MAVLAIERLDALPATLSPSTMYIVRSSESSLAEIVVTGTDVSEVRHLLNRSDVVSDTAALAAGTAAIGTSLKLARQDHVHPLQTTVSGNAGTASKLETARSISMTGDVSWSISSFDGGANVTAEATLKNDIVVAGSGTKLTYNSKGLITGKSDLAASDIPSLDWSKITTGVPSYLLKTGDTMTGDLTLKGDPTADLHAATKKYVDAIATGLRDFKESVRVVATTNITLSNAQTVDGTTLVAGDRVLVTGQNTASENGIYVVVASGAWTRATDADTTAKVTTGMFCYVEAGSTYQKTGWVLATTGAITIGTTGLSFVQFNGLATVVGGTGISITGNTVSLANTAVTAGTFGSTSKTLTATVDQQGRLTALTASNIAIGWSQLTDSFMTTGGNSSVRAVATSNVATLSGTQTIDGVALVAGDRVLLTAQTNGAANGVYVVSASAWSRAADADTAAEFVTGLFFYISEGTSNAKTGWKLTTTGAVTLGTTVLTFVKTSAIGMTTDTMGEFKYNGSYVKARGIELANATW